MTCIFCKIAAGEIPAEKFYEDEKHIAFLDLHPGTEGQSLLVPKQHFSSYVFDMPEEEYIEILKVARKLGKQLDKALGCDRTCLALEGLAVDHAHVRLHPFYKGKRFTFDGGPQATPEELKSVGEKIRKAV